MDLDVDEELPQKSHVLLQEIDSSDPIETLAHSVLDDILQNILHDILFKAHRTEKIARGNSAAIEIEQLAGNVELEATPSNSSTSSKPVKRIETLSAIHEDGNVYLKGNPLTTVDHIRCRKCNLPRLLYPADGMGARTPEDGVKHCKRRPYITKAGHDIYGIPFPRDDAKARKAAKKAQLSSQAMETSSFDSPGPSPPPSQTVLEPLTFPNAKCPRCSRFVDVRRFRAHLKGCMGLSSRASGRAAILKTSETLTGHGSQHGSPPPNSRKGTPMVATKIKINPLKRAKPSQDSSDDENVDVDDEDDEDYGNSKASPKKTKKTKIAPATPSSGKKWKNDDAPTESVVARKGVVKIKTRVERAASTDSSEF